MTTLRERALTWPKGLRIAGWLLLQPVRLVLWILDRLLTAPGIALLLLALAAFGGVAGYRYLYGSEFEFRIFTQDFYSNLSTELISIVITVLVIDGLYQARRRQADKASLLMRMRSKRYVTAVDAVEEARSRGWLQKGLAENADLRGANLRRADFQRAPLAGANLALATLRGADFRGADLTRVNLDQAILIGANLKGSTVTDEQLSLAYILAYAIMPDGSFYNGKLNLIGDFRGALQSNLDINRADQMAAYYSIEAEVSADPITRSRLEFYELSVDEYLDGQQWAGENLVSVREEGFSRLEAWGFEPLEQDEQARVVIFDLDESEPSDSELTSKSEAIARLKRDSSPLEDYPGCAFAGLLIGLAAVLTAFFLSSRLASFGKEIRMLRRSLQMEP